MDKLNAQGLYDAVSYDPSLLAFTHNGAEIRVPFLDMTRTGIWPVDPVVHYGFFEVETGGGCKALRLDRPDGTYLFLTDESGSDVPDDDWEACLIGVFNVDGEQLAYCTGIEAYESLD